MLRSTSSRLKLTTCPSWSRVSYQSKRRAISMFYQQLYFCRFIDLNILHLQLKTKLLPIDESMTFLQKLTCTTLKRSQKLIFSFTNEKQAKIDNRFRFFIILNKSLASERWSNCTFPLETNNPFVNVHPIFCFTNFIRLGVRQFIC